MDGGSTRLKRIFLALHGIWAVPCIGVLAFLATAEGGHPPALIFVPAALIVWISGHLLLWGSGRTAARSASQASGALARAPTWPVGIVATIAGAGITAFATFWLLARLVVDLDGSSNWITIAMLAVVVLAHGAVFIGLLARRPWARALAALTWLGWSALMLLQIADHLARGSRVAPTELALAIVLSAALGFMAYHIRFGDGPRAFPDSGPRQGPKAGE